MLEGHGDLGSRLVMGIDGGIIWLIGVFNYMLSRHDPLSKGFRAGRVRVARLKGRRKQLRRVPGLYPVSRKVIPLDGFPNIALIAPILAKVVF